MKYFGNVVQFAIVTTMLILSVPQAQASGLAAEQAPVFEFLHQYIDHATPENMPIDSRINMAIAAAKMQADALGADIDTKTLAKVARQPLAFFPASDTFFTWSGGQWQAYTRSTYNYTGGKKNTALSENWTGVWTNFSLFTWNYNGSGSISTYLYQTWDGGSSSWSNNLRTVMAYDGSDRLLTTEVQIWNGSSYDSGSRIVYTYDGNSRVATITNQSWIGLWMDLNRTTYTYDGNGNEIFAFGETSLGFVWNNSTQTTSTYSVGNLQLTEVRQNWNGSGWDNANKNEFEYDVSDNQTLDRSSDWQTGAWVVTDVDTLKYDGSNRFTQTVHNHILPTAGLTKDDYAYDGSGNLVSLIGQEFTSSWQNTSKVVMVYTSVAVKVDDASLPDGFVLLQNHPNPFNPTTTIRYSLARPQLVQIEVFNILGQLVRTLEDSYQGVGIFETTWDGADTSGRDVASGVYFYRLQAGDFAQTRKMVLSR